MRKFLVATLLLGLGACGGGGIEGEMKGFKDKMCKCTDKECADKTLKEYNDWAKGKRETVKDMSKGELEKLDGIDKEIKACRRKLRDAAGGDQPAGDPPAADKPAE
ncbi:MAG TPA: hypothetical protein VK932_15200 [Kofleriaceae bacterium]|nr:hypothetical protein [Kofleriaceae bacterium]